MVRVSFSSDLMINIEEVQQADVMSVSDKLRKNLRAMISVRFCKFAALCAIKLDHDFLKDEPVSYADLLVQSNSESPHSRLVRGAIKWVLGRCEDAIFDVEGVISVPTERGEHDV